MECWMLWHGGASYAHGEIPRDLEHFDSLRELRDAFARRLWDSYYPCVSDEPAEDGGPSGYVYLRDPSDECDPYPDRIIEFGPRGGVVVTPA